MKKGNKIEPGERYYRHHSDIEEPHTYRCKIDNHLLCVDLDIYP